MHSCAMLVQEVLSLMRIGVYAFHSRMWLSTTLTAQSCISFSLFLPAHALHAHPFPAAPIMSHFAP